jgi:hypothetical protein
MIVCVVLCVWFSVICVWVVVLSVFVWCCLCLLGVVFVCLCGCCVVVRLFCCFMLVCLFVLDVFCGLV